ncbi:putative 2-oxoglutarate-dependent dioxygenase AOP1, partial [Cucurbita argyrosperma subsp. sororia]
MDSEPSLKLPHIDFSNLEAGSPKWELAKALVKEALQEFGCFEASFDKVADEVRKRLFEALEELFDLPCKPSSETFLKSPSMATLDNTQWLHFLKAWAWMTPPYLKRSKALPISSGLKETQPLAKLSNHIHNNYQN